jgi:hypothetical protein
MDETKEPTPEVPERPFSFSLRNLDPETIEILVDDKIATGG